MSLRQTALVALPSALPPPARTPSSCVQAAATQGPKPRSEPNMGNVAGNIASASRWVPPPLRLRQKENTLGRGCVDIVVFFLGSRAQTAVRTTTIPRRPRCYGRLKGSFRVQHSRSPARPAALQGVCKHVQTVMEGEEEATAAQGGVLGRLQGPLCHS